MLFLAAAPNSWLLYSFGGDSLVAGRGMWMMPWLRYYRIIISVIAPVPFVGCIECIKCLASSVFMYFHVHKDFCCIVHVLFGWIPTLSGRKCS